jgi:hypothetical protein
LTNTTANFPNRSFESGEALFRRHWTENGGAHTSTYEQYQPAYQFGYNLGINPANSGRTWADLESEAHDAWEMRRQGTWDQYHDAIVFGWQQAAGSIKD